MKDFIKLQELNMSDEDVNSGNEEDTYGCNFSKSERCG